MDAAIQQYKPNYKVQVTASKYGERVSIFFFFSIIIAESLWLGFFRGFKHAGTSTVIRRKINDQVF